MKAMILGTGSKRGTRIVPNAEVVESWGLDTTEDWILTRTGLQSRCLAGSDEDFVNYGVRAAEEALENANLTIADIGMIIVATSTGREVPSCATDIAERLGTKCGAMSISAGCTGFLYALSTANGYVVSGMHKYVLVIGLDWLSRIANYADRSSCILFGDGAGAVVVGPVGENQGDVGMNNFILGCDGSINMELCIPTAKEARRLRRKHPKLKARAGKLFMNGNAIYEFAVKALQKLITELARSIGIKVEDICLIFAHQANLRILEFVAKRLRLPMSKIPNNIGTVGNTSAASVPILLDEVNRAGQLHDGEIVVLAAFGAGGTIGGCIMTWGSPPANRPLTS